MKPPNPKEYHEPARQIIVDSGQDVFDPEMADVILSNLQSEGWHLVNAEDFERMTGAGFFRKSGRICAVTILAAERLFGQTRFSFSSPLRPSLHP